MKKLKLNLDTLRVESFDTNPARAASRGTIAAHSGTLDPLCTYKCPTEAGTSQVSTQPETYLSACDCSTVWQQEGAATV